LDKTGKREMFVVEHTLPTNPVFYLSLSEIAGRIMPPFKSMNIPTRELLIMSVSS
jgi:hypothetical protein